MLLNLGGIVCGGTTDRVSGLSKPALGIKQRAISMPGRPDRPSHLQL